jgi:hypothetical protein
VRLRPVEQALKLSENGLGDGMNYEEIFSDVRDPLRVIKL